MRKTKAKAKIARKMKATKKNHSIITSGDGFLTHAGSPMGIDFLNIALCNLNDDQKKGGHIFEGMNVGTDPIRVAIAFQEIKLKAKADDRLFVLERNLKDKTVRITSAPGSDDSRLPIAYLKQAVVYMNRQQEEALRDLNGLKVDAEQEEAVRRAYNQAIISLEEFLVKKGELKFEDRTCQAGMHPFTPANSVSDACKECEEDFELDSLQAKKDAREKSEAAF